MLLYSQNLTSGTAVITDASNYANVKVPYDHSQNDVTEDIGVEVAEESYLTPMMAESSSGTKIRSINIEELNRGFIVRVGCHSFAISKAEEAANLVSDYIKDPSGTEEKWYSGKLMER